MHLNVLDAAMRSLTIGAAWPQYAAMLAAPDAAALQAAWAAQRPGGEQQPDASRVAALTLVRECCTSRLIAMSAASPSTLRSLAADRPEIAGRAEAEVSDSAPRLERLVAEVRARERRILERAKFLLTQQRSQLRT